MIDMQEEGERVVAAALRLKFAVAADRVLVAAASLFGKANFNPNQPRVPRGRREGGRWTDGDSGGDARVGEGVFARVTPDQPTLRVNEPDLPQDSGIGDRPIPESFDKLPVILASAGDSPPSIPPAPPPSEPDRLKVIKQVARFLFSISPAGRALRLIKVGFWLYDHSPEIRSFLDAPKSLEELHSAVGNGVPGYETHHIVEQTPASNRGYAESDIESLDNLVRIPKIKHWQITAWYATKNRRFGGLSPREYLRDKSWVERRRIGLQALKSFGVLKP